MCEIIYTSSIYYDAEIPPQLWYLKTMPSALMAGILPFGAAFIEIYFVLSSLFGCVHGHSIELR